MPIIDYKLKAEQSRRNIFANDKISKHNKEMLEDFLKAYDVSPARLNIFLKHIKFLLEASDNIKRDINDRKKINIIFNKIRTDLSPVYYATVINVSLRFVRWLNDGDKPIGFKDINNKPKKSQRRSLKPADMITWPEGLKMAEQTNSMQLKAIILTQLDGGFRPSEFTDLCFGDIRKEGKYLIAHVKGKTGERDVILWDSIPYLQRWLQNHPFKKAGSPLWVTERKYRNREKGRYDYFAMQMIVRDIGRRAGIKKPLDFYNLRHSSACLKKLQNMPMDLAAKSMGHSVEYFDEVYGRLSISDQLERMDKLHGLKTDKEEDKNNPIQCQFCDTINKPKTEVCEKCGSPMTLKAAMDIKNNKDVEINQLKKQMDRINKIVEALALEKKLSK